MNISTKLIRVLRDCHTSPGAGYSVPLTFSFRGGLIVNAPTGVDGHISTPSGTRTYDSLANFTFKPQSGVNMVTPFPATAVRY